MEIIHLNATDEFKKDPEKMKAIMALCEAANKKYMEESKIKITSMHLEKDVVNKSLTLILTDESGKEWALTHKTVCMEGGGMVNIEPKEDSWYFKKPEDKKG